MTSVVPSVNGQNWVLDAVLVCCKQVHVSASCNFTVCTSLPMHDIALLSVVVFVCVLSTIK